VTSSHEARRNRLHDPCSGGPYVLTYLYGIADDVFAIEQGGEMSLVDGATLKSLLKQLSGKDVLP